MEKPKTKPKASIKIKTESNKPNDNKNKNIISPTKHTKFPLNNQSPIKLRNRKHFGSTDLKNPTVKKIQTQPNKGSAGFSVSPKKKKHPTNVTRKNNLRQQGLGTLFNTMYDRSSNEEKKKINTTINQKTKNESFQGKTDTNNDKLKSFEKHQNNNSNTAKNESNIIKNKKKGRISSPTINRDLLNVKQNSIFNYTIEKRKNQYQNYIVSSPGKKNNNTYQYNNTNTLRIPQKKPQTTYMKSKTIAAKNTGDEKNKPKNKVNDNDIQKPVNKLLNNKNNEVKNTNDKNLLNKKEANNIKAKEKKVDGKKTEEKKNDDKKAEDKKTEDNKIEEKKVEEKKVEEKKIEEKKDEVKKDEDKKNEDKKVEDKKVEEKKDEEKKDEEKKVEEKITDNKPLEEQKPEEKQNIENNDNNAEGGEKLEDAAGNLLDDMFSDLLGDGTGGDLLEENNIKEENKNNVEENNIKKEENNVNEENNINLDENLKIDEEKAKIQETEPKKKKKSKKHHHHHSKSQCEVNLDFIPKQFTDNKNNLIDQESVKKAKDYESKKISLMDTICKKGFAGEGVKKINQDNYFIYKNFLNNENYVYLGVCDGHGKVGQDISEYLHNNLAQNLNNKLIEEKTTDLINTELYIICKSINKIFIKTQEDLIADEKIDTKFSGSTCSTLIFTPDRIITANVGDSRCVLGKFDGVKWFSQNLTKDHKPTLPNEKKRIENSGGMVEPCKDDEGGFVGPDRVWIKGEKVPGLAMSRSFGDETAHMVGVISEPEILDYYFLHEDKFLMIASDGIWEFISSDECVKIVKDYYLKKDLEGALNYLYKESTKRWMMEEEMIDDITLILVFLE